MPPVENRWMARVSSVPCRCDHRCYLHNDGQGTVKPYAFEPKPSWEHKVKNVRQKKDRKRNRSVLGVPRSSLLWAAFGNGLQSQACT